MSAAAMSILHQMENDPRLAWLLGPGSPNFDLLIEEAAPIYGRTVEDLRQRVESRLKYEPWPTELMVEIDPQAILLAAPDPRQACWHGQDNSYSSRGYIVWRSKTEGRAHVWMGYEKRKAVLGHEEWTSDFRFYVPDNFGNLVEVPKP